MSIQSVIQSLLLDYSTYFLFLLEQNVTENHLALVNKDVKQQTMADIFQEVFNPTHMEVAVLPVRSTGYNPELLLSLSEMAVQISMEIFLFIYFALWQSWLSWKDATDYADGKIQACRVLETV